MVYQKHTSIMLISVALSVATFIFIKNAWVTEDAYIIFRSIEQLFAGNGPVWNPHERVQVFTSPLWYSVLALVRIFYSDIYINVVIVSFILYLSTILVLKKIFKDMVSIILLSLMLAKVYSIKFNLFILLTIFLYLMFYTHTPFNSSFDYSNRKIEMGVADERGCYFEYLSLYKYLFRNSDQKDQIFPYVSWPKAEYKFMKSSDKVIVKENIGVFGYQSGTEKIIVDPFALSDPLLARMPVSGFWRIGHFRREIPEGYVASIMNGNETITNTKINKYYKKLKIITQNDILISLERLKTIMLFNIGTYDHLLFEE